jgi:membrane protease YdiL (CAAX protease family)
VSQHSAALPPRLRAWIALQAIVGGLAIAIIGGLIWGGLVALNLSLSPLIPWSIPVMVCILALGWRLTGRKQWSWPSFDKQIPAIPHEYAQPKTYWAGAALGLAGFLLLTLAVRYLALPVSPLPEGTSQVPIQSLAYFAMASCVAALSEEGGLRGWMQTGLSSAVGSPIAFAVVAVSFAALHAAGAAFLQLLPIYIAMSLAFSWLVRWSGTIWPAVAGHALADFLSYCLLLLSANWS